MLKLVTHQDKTSAETVDILKSYLQKAKEGKIVEVAIAAVEPDGSVTHIASATEHSAIQIGAVVRLLHQMNLRADEVTKDVV
jgi:hypothetical protein